MQNLGFGVRSCLVAIASMAWACGAPDTTGTGGSGGVGGAGGAAGSGRTFRGDGVRFDASDSVLGLGSTTLSDLNRALELAAQCDVYLMLTLFSFDNFRATRNPCTTRY